MCAENRKFMHCPSFKEGMAESDQAKGVQAPPFGRPVSGPVAVLPSFGRELHTDSYSRLLDIRRSVRKFADVPMTGEQLAFMLWSVQGIQEIRGGGVATLRTVPSGGARHPFETYVAARSVDGISAGLYRYLPAENIGGKRCALEKLGGALDGGLVSRMLAGQSWAARASVVLFYSCVPYRAEWRYADMAHRVMLIDLGHAGQNAMLSAAALGLGSCCMAAYDQKLCDEALGLDGLDEYTVYAIAVGTRDAD